MRTCDQCGEPMRAGYCIDSGAEYYCSDECLCQNYTPGQYESMYDNGEGDSYYTEWDDEPTNQETAMQTFKTVDLAPTWREILPALLALLEVPETRQDALDELAKMAGAADYLASLARAGRISPAPRQKA